jgi:hypothetical protein
MLQDTVPSGRPGVGARDMSTNTAPGKAARRAGAPVLRPMTRAFVCVDGPAGDERILKAVRSREGAR